MRFASRLFSLGSLFLMTFTGAACGGGSTTPPPPVVTYTIAGTITGAASVSVALGGGATATTTTTAGGTYSFAGLANGNYTVTPSKAGYTFSPASITAVVASANLPAQNFTATAVGYTVSGTITGTTAVTVTLGGGVSPQVTTSDGSGAYAFTATAGTYTITPSKAGYTFSPLSTVVTVNGANLPGNDFTATAAATTYSISGAVSGATQDGVTVTISQGGTTLGTTSTAGGGGYAFAGLVNGAYVLTPTKAGYTFSPTSLNATVAGANLPAQNFVATAVTYTIAGTITGAASVSVALGGGATAYTTTDGSGNYSFAGLANGSYTVTPSKAGYTFSPASLAVTVAGANVGGRNFAATATAGYTISGAVAGPWVQGVTVTLGGAQTATATTDALGAYSFTGLADGTYSLTPRLDGYTYAPAAPSVTLGGANRTQGFTATPVIPSYAISGTVSYGGAKTGRVYLSVYSTSCSNCSAWAGTSIAAPGAYTIRGLTPGSYQVMARRDSVGMGVRNANDPSGMTAGTVTITSADVPGANITMTDPAVPTADVPTNLGLIPGSGGMLVMWDRVSDMTGTEKATSYNLCIAPNPTGAGCIATPNLPATDDAFFIHSGLTNTPYSYMVRSNVGASSSAWSPVVTATAGPAAGGSTVSGTVTYGGTATGPLLLAVGDPNAGAMQIASFPTPAVSPAAFSVAGVANGRWRVYAIIDQNANGFIDDGDLSNTNGRGSPRVTISGNTSGVSVTLSSAKSRVSTTTEHALNDGGTVHSYSLQTTVTANLQRVVRATLVAGKNVRVPADLGGDREISTWWNLGTTAPAVGDVYTYEVAYGDGSSELLTAPVTTLLSSFAQGLTATTSGGGSVARPLFSWSAPASPPVYYGYTLSVWGNANWYWPQGAYMSPSSITQVRYNVDSSASPPSLITGSYTWSVTVMDAAGNGARQEKSYIVP